MRPDVVVKSDCVADFFESGGVRLKDVRTTGGQHKQVYVRAFKSVSGTSCCSRLEIGTYSDDGTLIENLVLDTDHIHLILEQIGYLL